MFKKLAYPAGKKGGAKLKSPTTEGHKGIIPGVTYPAKAKISRSSGIDSPSLKGDKGLSHANPKKVSGESQAPLSE